MKKLRKDVRKRTIEYTQQEIKNGRVPTYQELRRKFKIDRFKITTKDIYLTVGIRLLDFPLRTRPQRSTEILRRELIIYLKEEVKKNHYPSRREIEHKFRLKLSPYIAKSIKDLYKIAKISYKQHHNQSIKSKKAKILQEIVAKNIKKLELEIILQRGVAERGIDLIAKDKKGRIVGIELKAYNQHEIVKKRNIRQIEKWLEKENFYKIILITTTSKLEKNMKVPKKLKIIIYEDLIKLLKKDNIKDLAYIRSYSIHHDNGAHEKKRRLIKDYIVKNYEDDQIIRIQDINKILKLNIPTYFKSGLHLYDYCRILPPMSVLRSGKADNDSLISKYFNIWKSKILNYIKKEVSKGHYPSGIDINKEFRICHIWRYMKVSDLYREIGLEPYHERKSKFKISSSSVFPPSKEY